MQDLILIGKILKAQGIKGELKVKPITSKIERFKTLKYAIIDNNMFNIAHVRIGVDNFVYIIFSEISDRNNAELLKNKEIYINREDRLELSEDEYFIDDLMNSSVIDENNNEIGFVVNVENYGATDIITVNQGMGMSFSFPLIKEVIINFNSDKKLLTLNSTKLAEIKV